MKKKDSTESTPRRGFATVASVARVDLIPPIVGIRRKQNAQIRSLMTGLVLLAIIVIVISLAVSFFANGAEKKLTAEQTRGAQLIVEQNQYSEVAGIKAQLIDYETARWAALYSEADWARIMRELDSAMPDGVDITAEAIAVKGLGTANRSTKDANAIVIDKPGVIEVAFTAQSDIFESPTAILNALAKTMTGFTSANVDSVVGAREDGYVVTGIVQLNAGALGGTSRTGSLDAETLEQLHKQLEQVAIAPPAAVAPAAEATEDADQTSTGE
ncbi:hypothetical protein [Microbacterium sp. GXF6406]